MSKATYDTKFRRWVLLYKSPDGKGGYKFRRKYEQDRAYPTLPARAQNKRQKEMTAAATALESAAMSGQEAPQELTHHKETAVDAFRAVARQAQKAMQGGMSCAGILTTAARPRGVKEAVGIVNSFATWLEAHHAAATLDAITTEMAVKYAQELRERGKDNDGRGLSRNTIRHHISRLSWLYKKFILTKRAKVNPFADKKDILGLVRGGAVFKRKTITAPAFGSLLRDIVREDRSIRDEKTAFNAFAVFYFGIVTGWREADIANKKWRDTRRTGRAGTIYNRHHKTAGETGSETTLPLTPLGLRILDILERINAEDGNAEDAEYIFKFSTKGRLEAVDGETEKERADRVALNEMRNLRAFQTLSGQIFARLNEDTEKDKVQSGKNKISRTSFHSLRGTVISHLFGRGISESIIVKMVGHAADTVERKHYQTFTPRHFEAAVNLMEREFVFNSFWGTMRAQGVEIKTPLFMELSGARDEMAAREDDLAKRIHRAGLDTALAKLKKDGVGLDEVLSYYRRKANAAKSFEAVAGE